MDALIILPCLVSCNTYAVRQQNDSKVAVTIEEHTNPGKIIENELDGRLVKIDEF